MANTEVGTAWVTIIPSAKGFAKELQKAIAKEFKGSNLDRLISDALAGTRVTIPARAELDTSDIPDQLRGREPELPVRLDPLLAEFQSQLRTELGLAQVSADVPVHADADALRTEITAVVDAVERSVDADIDTDPAGEVEYERGLRSMVAAVARRVRATIHADVEVDKPSLDRLHQTIDVDAGRSVGERIADGASKGFLSRFGDSIKGALPTSPWVIAAGTAIGAALAIPVSAALTGGLLGGAGVGLIGLGALILKEEPEVKNAAGRLMKTVASVFKDAASPLATPIAEALEMVRWAVIRWGPQFSEMFALIAPAVKPLTEGLIGFVSNVLPGIVELIREATPFLIYLAGQLPRLGEYIGGFFRIIDGGGPEAAIFFNDLITTVGLLLLAVGAFIRVATELYPLFRTIVLLSPIGAFLGLINVIWQTRDAVNSFASQAKATFQRLSDFVSGIFRSMRNEPEAWVKFILGIPGRILRGLGDLDDLLWGAGRSIMQGLINGLRSMVGPLENTLGWITDMIPNWKGPEDKDRVLLQPAGEAIMGGLIRGIHGERRALEAELGSVTSLIQGTPLTSPPSSFGAVAAATPPPARLSWAPGATGDAVLDAFQEMIRVDAGGDVQARLGTP